MHRYRDSWNAFPSQIPPVNTLPEQPIGNGKESRLVSGMAVVDTDEEEWKEHEGLMKRQGGGLYALPSKSASGSSISPALSTGENPVMLQTSFISSSSGDGTTSTDVFVDGAASLQD
jgi:hypothetical protein